MLKVFLPQRWLPKPGGRYPLLAALPLFLLFSSSPVCAAKVLIVGDIQYALVADVSAQIQMSLRSQVKEYAISEVRGRLGAVVYGENAQVVVALGKSAVAEALRLPPEIAVVYGLVVAPSGNGRPNLTGVYMSAPVSEYVSTVRRFLPALSRVSVVGSRQMMNSLLTGDHPQVLAHHVESASQLVETVNRLADAGSLLLLPDADLLTAQALSQVYLFSFRNNIPLLGISEANVKQGALFALVFDAREVSRQIGNKVQAILNGVHAAEMPASAPGKFNMYVNSSTARKMGIDLPGDMLKKAKRVY